MKILGLDPSTVTGWALLESGVLVSSGTWDLGAKVSRGERANAYRTHLEEAVRIHRPDLVAYEHPLTSRGKNGVFLGGLVLTTEGVCEALLLPHVFVWTTTLKLFATGKGNADKPAMIAKADELTGRVLNEHESDAFHVARWAAANVEAEAVA